jgi:hypothetical protein
MKPSHYVHMSIDEEMYCADGGGGLGPIVNWFVPAPVLSAMMLPGRVWGFFSFYFRRRDGLVDLMQSSLARSEKPMSSSSRETRLKNLK